MSDPRRILAHLAPATSSWRGDTPRETSGERTDWSHAAALLARVGDPVASLLLRVKWGGQERYLPELHFWALRRVRELAREGEWRGMAPGRDEQLAGLALLACLQGGVCPRCRGRVGEEGRTVAISARGVACVCPDCLGTGLARLSSQRGLARRLGVSEAAWRKTWRERFERVTDWLDDKENRGLARMREE